MSANLLPLYSFSSSDNGQPKALGHTVSELDISQAAVPAIGKSKFSMCLRDVTTQLPVPSNVAIVGIESHVCVLQTTLDLLRAGHHVYVISDGVSSCNKEEVPIAIARMRQAGAFITTSESFVSFHPTALV
jgi:isochorismate hydrolase